MNKVLVVIVTILVTAFVCINLYEATHRHVLHVFQEQPHRAPRASGLAPIARPPHIGWAVNEQSLLAADRGSRSAAVASTTTDSYSDLLYDQLVTSLMEDAASPSISYHPRIPLVPLPSNAFVDSLRSQTLSICKDPKQTSKCHYHSPNEVYCKVQRLLVNIDELRTHLEYDNLPAPERTMSFTRKAFDIDRCEERSVLTSALRSNGAAPRLSTAEWIDAVDSRADITPDQCHDGWWTGMTYLISRYEYVNVYHTLVDQYAMWVHANLFGLESLHDLNMVYVDPHLPGSIDGIWNAMTGREPTRVSALIDDPTVSRVQCFENAFMGNANDNTHINSMLTSGRGVPWEEQGPLFLAFRQQMRNIYDVGALNPIAKEGETQLTLIVRRDYAKTERRLIVDRKFSNEKQVIEALQELDKVNLVVVDMARMPFEEQVVLMERTDILVGFHGAGLTQLLFLPDAGRVVEITSAGFSSRPHFRNMSRLLGLTYATVQASGSADITVDTGKLKQEIERLI